MPASLYQVSWRGSAALGRDDVHLARAGVLGRVGDPLAVRGDLGEELQPGMVGQLAGRAARGGHRPDVAGVDEDHQVLVHVGKSQQPGVLQGERRGSSATDRMRSRMFFSSKVLLIVHFETIFMRKPSPVAGPGIQVRRRRHINVRLLDTLIREKTRIGLSISTPRDAPVRISRHLLEKDCTYPLRERMKKQSHFCKYDFVPRGKPGTSENFCRERKFAFPTKARIFLKRV